MGRDSNGPPRGPAAVGCLVAFVGDGQEAQGQFKDLGNCLCFPGHDSAKLPLFPQGSWSQVSQSATAM